MRTQIKRGTHDDPQLLNSKGMGEFVLESPLNLPQLILTYFQMCPIYLDGHFQVKIPREKYEGTR